MATKKTKIVEEKVDSPVVEVPQEIEVPQPEDISPIQAIINQLCSLGVFDNHKKHNILQSLEKLK